MNFRKIYLLLFIIIISSLNCGKEPVFTEMSTNRLTIRLKGTFETESTSNFVTMASRDVETLVSSSGLRDDSVDDVSDSTTLSGAAAGMQDDLPTTLMLDIAEIRLSGKKISNYRQVLEIPLSDAADHPFFNGTGIVLKTDDPGDGYYDSVQFYIRKMVLDNAKVYQSTGSGFVYEKDAEVIFHENTRLGLDINQLMVNSYWDSLRLEQSETIRVFPMVIPIVGGLTYNRENDETVLEIRLVIKNFIKKYEYDYYEDGVYKVCHYYGPSDWLRDVRAGETDIGRNLHGVARSYVEGNTGSIGVSAGGTSRYVVAIPITDDISEYGISATGVSLRTTVGNSDLPLPPSYPGAYIDAVLDYYLKYEKYKNDWNTKSAGLTVDLYEAAWDDYEAAVHGYSSYGLKIPPYVAFTGTAGNSVTFNNITPGSYKFYYCEYNPATATNYGKLFLVSEFIILNSGNPVNILAGTNAGF
jgi:hypothetical protein